MRRSESEHTNIEITQNTHLHPLSAARKPPHTGPTTEPRRIPRVNIAIANPRSSCLIISAIIAPPFVKGAAANIPCNNLIPMRVFRFFESAHATENIKNPMLPICCTSRRPYTSDNGAKRRGPVAKPSTKTVTTKEPRIEFVEWSSVIRAGTLGANMEELSPAMKVMKLTRVMSVHLRQVGQLRGLSASEEEESQEMICAFPVASTCIDQGFGADSRSADPAVLLSAF